jgi:hypothetical protein
MACRRAPPGGRWLEVRANEHDAARVVGSARDAVGADDGMTRAPERDAGWTESEPILVEPRWPVALAVGTYLAIMIVLRVFVPDRPTLGARWLVPGLMALLLVALVAADPAHITAPARWLRRLASALIVSLAVVALIGTAILIADLVRGSAVTEKASTLLVSGALIWLGNVLVFSLSTGTSTAAERWPVIAASGRTGTSPSPNTSAPSSHHPAGVRSTWTTSYWA